MDNDTAAAGVAFGERVCWRTSRRGLVLAGIDDGAFLLDHPRAALLPDMLADQPDPALLARRLGEPNSTTLVAEMLDLGVLRDVSGSSAIGADAQAGVSGTSRSVVLTRSGAEFTGIARPARWLDRHVVPILFSWPGRLLLGATALAGIISLCLGRPPGPTVSSHPAIDALLGVLVMLLCAALHELAHAVALVHFGRTPRRAGFGFYWGGISFYVDSSEALTLPRRHRVIQALAGLGADMVTVSVLAITAQVSATVLIVVVAWRLAVVGVVDIVSNLMPILEVDGHWALADHLDEPELAPRARAAFGRALRGRSRPATEARWLAGYGAFSLVGGLALLGTGAGVWWIVARDLVIALLSGSVTEVVVGVVLVGPVAIGLLASSAGLLVETVVDPATPAATTSEAP